MNRRDAFLAMLLIGANLRPLHANAQPPKAGRPRRIGALTLDFEVGIPVAQRLPMITLRKLGWIEGENFLLEHVYADLKAERLAPLAEELVRKRVDLIWAFGPDAALAAARATQSIPIVFWDVPFPVEQGLIDSYARPGRNATGTSFFTDFGVNHKIYEYLRAVAPAARRLFRLAQPDSAATLAGGRVTLPNVGRPPAERLGFELRSHEISKLEDIDTALADVTVWRADAIIVTGGHHLYAERKRIAEFALRHRLPSAYPWSDCVEAGGLLSYGVAGSEVKAMIIRGAEYVDLILRGARPGELPVHRPSKYELVINAKTAKALDLNIPQTVLISADRVIE